MALTSQEEHSDGLVTGPRCEGCGRPARVHILEGYREGKPVTRASCLHCADTLLTKPGARPMSSAPRNGWAILLMAAGAVLAVSGVLADQVGVRGASGFGGYQVVGVIAGALSVLIGAVLRSDAVGAAGLVVLVLAASADLLHFGGQAGFGWKQRAAVVLGLLLVFAGQFGFQRLLAPSLRLRSNAGKE